MTTTDYPVFDFLTASKVERPLADALKVWMGKFSDMFVDRWREFAPTDISVTPMLINALSFESAEMRWSQPSMGVPIAMSDGAVQGMMVSQRVDMLILMMEILSETLTQRPEDRALTTIEASLCELFFQQSANTLSEAWPKKERLPITIGPLDDQPNRTRMFPPQHEVLLTGFEVQTSCGADAGPARVEWVFAKNELTKLMGVDTSAPTPSDDRKIPPENITEMTVDVAARLGLAEIQMDDLMHLDVGDIVKLDQSIEDPLTLLVNDHPTFRVWPGRCGDRQCAQIES